MARWRSADRSDADDVATSGTVGAADRRQRTGDRTDAGDVAAGGAADPGARRRRTATWPDIGWVAAGGAAGATFRYLIGLACPVGAGNWPWSTLAINLAGAALLGCLWGSLHELLEQGAARAVWLGLGTGLLGAFTTYSAFGVETAQLISSGHLAGAATYVGASIGAGVALSLGGIWVGGHLRWRGRR